MERESRLGPGVPPCSGLFPVGSEQWDPRSHLGSVDFIWSLRGDSEIALGVHARLGTSLRVGVVSGALLDPSGHARLSEHLTSSKPKHQPNERYEGERTGPTRSPDTERIALTESAHTCRGRSATGCCKCGGPWQRWNAAGGARDSKHARTVVRRADESHCCRLLAEHRSAPGGMRCRCGPFSCHQWFFRTSGEVRARRDALRHSGRCSTRPCC